MTLPCLGGPRLYSHRRRRKGLGAPAVALVRAGFVQVLRSWRSAPITPVSSISIKLVECVLHQPAQQRLGVGIGDDLEATASRAFGWRVTLLRADGARLAMPGLRSRTARRASRDRKLAELNEILADQQQAPSPTPADS